MGDGSMTDPNLQPEHLRELADLIERRRWERAGATADSVWAEWEADVASRADPATVEALEQLMEKLHGHQAMPNGPVDTIPPPPSDPTSRGPPPGDGLDDEPVTELGYAHRLIGAFGDYIRFVPAWKRWLVWDACRWKPDETGQVDRWMKIIARDQTTAALQIADPAVRKARMRDTSRAESSAAVRGALTLASTEPGIAVRAEDLDAHPHLLNCLNGVLDLASGSLGPHDPDLLLTKVTGAAYNPEARGPFFDAFLARIQPEAEMRAYLARLLGHALEGQVTNHILSIFHGPGANGKSILLGAVKGALGDYCDAGDPDLLTARSFEAHPTGVADLFGLRLAILHESDNGRRLAEGTVKRLTGSDRVKARRMREDFWSFQPSHTFVMQTNHRPLVTGTDEGIWRRLRLVPFEVTIPAAERDEYLDAKLARELDAVLAWLVAGWHDFRCVGLAEPEKVTAATAAYRSDSDNLGRFLAERCMTVDSATVRSSELFAAWAAWCARESIEAGSNKAFSAELTNRGFDKQDRRAGVFWMGLGLYADERDR
jgi:putative DNA primase/helicase